MSWPMEKICVDVDNVVAGTDALIRRIIQDFTQDRVVLEYEDITDFDYCHCKDRKGNSINEKEWLAVHQTFSEDTNILAIKPLRDARKSLGKIAQLYEIHIVTTRIPNAWKSTIEWLLVNGIPHRFLHFVGHRQKHESLKGFSYAVEDDYEQALRYLETGTPCYLLRHPWNAAGKPKPGLHWVDDWSELEQRLLMA